MFAVAPAILIGVLPVVILASPSATAATPFNQRFVTGTRIDPLASRSRAAASKWDGGYAIVDSSGRVFTMGDAGFYGDETGLTLNKPIVGMAASPDGGGYWLVGSDGGIFAFGDATFFGSTGSLTLNKPIVGMAATPDGGGYWLVGSDGGIFAFGDATFFGSTGSLTLNKPIVGMAATPDGGGYWLVGSDGGIFAFGDATFFGSTGSLTLNKPIVGMAATPDGGGYWLVGSDGGIFAFGDATFFGSTGSLTLNKPIVGMAATPDGGGYWLVGSDGGIFAFGDATFSGSAISPLQPPAYPATYSHSQPAIAGVVAEKAGPQTIDSGTPRVLFVGDSLAVQTGYYTSLLSPGFSTFNGAILGCGITGNAPIDLWSGGNPVTPPSACSAWEQQYQWAVDGWHPNVVVFLAGYWESQPRLFNGAYVNLADNSAYVTSVQTDLTTALDILHSEGASGNCCNGAILWRWYAAERCRLLQRAAPPGHLPTGMGSDTRRECLARSWRRVRTRRQRLRGSHCRRHSPD